MPLRCSLKSIGIGSSCLAVAAPTTATVVAVGGCDMVLLLLLRNNICAVSISISIWTSCEWGIFMSWLQHSIVCNNADTLSQLCYFQSGLVKWHKSNSMMLLNDSITENWRERMTRAKKKNVTTTATVTNTPTIYYSHICERSFNLVVVSSSASFEICSMM